MTDEEREIGDQMYYALLQAGNVIAGSNAPNSALDPITVAMIAYGHLVLGEPSR